MSCDIYFLVLAIYYVLGYGLWAMGGERYLLLVIWGQAEVLPLVLVHELVVHAALEVVLGQQAAVVCVLVGCEAHALQVLLHVLGALAVVVQRERPALRRRGRQRPQCSSRVTTRHFAICLSCLVSFPSLYMYYVYIYCVCVCVRVCVFLVCVLL